MTDPDDAHTQVLAAAHDDPTAWFEQLYVEAADGSAAVPWDLDHPGAAVVAWAQDRDLSGVATLVVGCGYGRDAEFLAGRGARVVAFDIAPTAVAAAMARHPGSRVEYVTADLLAPPPAWLGGFALVVEAMNVQALPEPVRSQAVAAVGRLVAPAGQLLVVEFAREDSDAVEPGPPWPFTREEVTRFAGRDLQLVEVIGEPGGGPVQRWRATFTRAAGDGAGS